MEPKNFYCPCCGWKVVISGNWAGCRNAACDGGTDGRNWQGRIRDIDPDEAPEDFTPERVILLEQGILLR